MGKQRNENADEEVGTDRKMENMDAEHISRPGSKRQQSDCEAEHEGRRDEDGSSCVGTK